MNAEHEPTRSNSRENLAALWRLIARCAGDKDFPFSFSFSLFAFSFFLSISLFRRWRLHSLPSKMARRPPPSAAAARRRDGDNGNPFRTLIDLQDALRTKSVLVLDGSTAPGISNGTLAQDVPVLASGSGGGGGGRRRGTSGGGDGAASAAAATTVAALSAASVASSSHSSSSNTSNNNINNAQQSSSAIGPLGAAAHLAGGRGYTAEAWEPTRQSLLDEQQVLAARLRAVLGDALETDIRENGVREQGVNTTKEDSPNNANDGPTLLQRNAHTVLQLLGVTEATHGGYVLQDYAAPYLSRLARREHRQSKEMDGAAQLLREHRSALARETAVDGGAGDGAEQDRAEVEVEEEEMMRPSTGRRAGTRHRLTRSTESVASSSTNRARVTADEYAKKYLPSHRSSSAKSGRGRGRGRATTFTNASRTSAAAAAAGGRQYEGPRRTKKKGKKSKTKQPQVAAGAGGGNGGARREKRHLEKTAEWDSILRQARRQERQDQHEKQEHLLEILRYQAMEAEAQAEAQAQDQAKAKAKARRRSNKRRGARYPIWTQQVAILLHP